MLENYRVAAQLVASRAVLSSTVSYNRFDISGTLNVQNSKVPWFIRTTRHGKEW
jgi:hypothetical protein